jgi:CRP/FNR family cyclic AMP-dependent transcriptional regulator
MRSQSYYQQLANNPWFANLPEVVIDKLVLLCKVKSVKKGEQLLAKNAPADGLFCVLISLFDGLPRTHDSFAQTESTLLMLPSAAFQQLLIEHPELYPHFIRQLCQRIRTLFSLLDETTGLGLKERLAKRLIMLSNNWVGMANSQINDVAIEQNQAESYQEEVMISQESLASMLNVSRQTINKLLQEMKNEQLIDLRYGRIVLSNPRGLQQLGEL